MDKIYLLNNYKYYRFCLVCVCVVCVHVCMETRGKDWVSSSITPLYLFICFRLFIYSLIWDRISHWMELTNLVRLAGQGTPSIHPSLPTSPASPRVAVHDVTSSFRHRHGGSEPGLSFRYSRRFTSWATAPPRILSPLLSSEIPHNSHEGCSWSENLDPSLLSQTLSLLSRNLCSDPEGKKGKGKVM